MRKFVSWLQTNSDDAFKDIKEELNNTHYCNIIATTTKGYAKMYYTNNTPCFNVQAAYDVFAPKGNKTVVDLSHHEFICYNRWHSKYKTTVDATWFSDKKVVILQPKTKYSQNRNYIDAISKLLVPDPRAQWSDIEVVTTKTKKEYDYLTSIAPDVPTISTDDIETFVNITNDWWKNQSNPGAKIKAQFFKYLMMDNSKHFINALWAKTPFANQRFIERKMCCITDYYNDWDEFGNKDLVTKAYYTYANKHCCYMNQSDVCEIIDHITKTCAQEIETLNKMLSDIDTPIK